MSTLSTNSRRKKKTEAGLKQVLTSAAAQLQNVGEVEDIQLLNTSMRSDATPMNGDGQTTTNGGGSTGSTTMVGNIINDREKEDLLIANLELKRSLAILQRGIVESMNGNKSRFLGKSSGSGLPPITQQTPNKNNYRQKSNAQSEPRCGAGTGHHDLVDLDELKGLVEKKRYQLMELESKLEDVEGMLKQMQIEKDALEKKHLAALEKFEEERRQWELERIELEERYHKDLTEKLQDQLKDQEDEFEQKLKSKQEDFESRMKELENRLNSEKEELNRNWEAKLEEEKNRANARESELEALILELESKVDGLSNELEGKVILIGDLESLLLDRKNELSEQAEFWKKQMSNFSRDEREKMEAELQSRLGSLVLDEKKKREGQIMRLTMQAFVKGQETHKEGLMSWVWNEWKSVVMESRMEKERARQQEAQRRIQDELDKTQAVDREGLEKKFAEKETLLKKRIAELEKGNGELKKQKVSLDDKLKQLQKSLDEQKSLVMKGQGKIKGLEEQIKKLEEKVDKLSKPTPEPSKQLSMLDYQGSNAEELRKKQEFYRKREETLVKENQQLQDKLKENELRIRQMEDRIKLMELAEQRRGKGNKNPLLAKNMLKQELKQENTSKLEIDKLKEELESLKKSLQKAQEEVAELQEQKIKEKEKGPESTLANKPTTIPATQSSTKKIEIELSGDNIIDKNGHHKEYYSEGAQREIAELTADKMELLKRIERAEEDVASMRKIKSMDQKHYDEELRLAEEKVTTYKKAIEENLQECRKSMRMLVTAPKISINVGGDELFINANFPYAVIKEAVRNEVIPKFQKCMQISNQYSNDPQGDSEVKKLVYKSVEDLALTLQTKVHELLPQAEGTCNWDGFGSKQGSIIATTGVGSGVSSNSGVGSGRISSTNSGTTVAQVKQQLQQYARKSPLKGSV